MAEKQNKMLARFLSKTGQIVTVTTRRDMKVRAKFKHMKVEKVSTYQCRAGVDYDNIKAVKEKRESGELPKENQGLKWGEWKVFPYVISHKDNLYLRFSTIKTNVKSKVTFLVDDKEVKKEDIQDKCLSSEFSSSDSRVVFNIKLNSLKEIK
jgi:hypothetical protein